MVTLQTLFSNGLEKVKGMIEDVMPVIATQIRHAQTAKKAIALELLEFDEDETSQFEQHPKAQTFIRGVDALACQLKMVLETLYLVD